MRESDLPEPGELMQHGRIASVDLAGGRVTVELGDLITQPIRYFTGASGGTRVWIRPKVGEQVTLFCPEGDIAAAVALRGLDCADFPPIGDPNRDLIRFEDEAVIAYNPTSHTLEAVLPAGATVSITAPGGVTIAADVRITGDLQVTGKIDANGDIASATDVTAGSVSLKNHKHLGVTTGGGVSGLPQP